MAEIRVDGLKELKAALEALPKELGSKGGGPIRSALFQATKAMRDDARARAPVDTGRLRDNIIAIRHPNPRAEGLTEAYGITVRRGRVGKKRQRYHTSNAERDAFYGRYVELGTSKMPARPFLRPAFETLKVAAVQIFRNALAAAIARAVKKLAKVPR